MLRFLRRLLGLSQRVEASQQVPSGNSQNIRSEEPQQTPVAASPQDVLREAGKILDGSTQAQLEQGVALVVKLGCAHPDLVDKDARRMISAMITHLDGQLSDQLNEILCAPDFRSLESAWLGLHYLVMNSKTGATLQIRVLNISKTELRCALETPPGEAWQNGPISDKLFHEVYQTEGAAPYGLLVVDQYFDHSKEDIGLLRDIARICALCQTPMVGGVAPSLFDLADMGVLSANKSLDATFGAPDYDDWNELRRSNNSRYVGLCLPRVRARLPYGEKLLRVEGFTFEERILANKDLAWMNAAYAKAVIVARSVTQFGWPSQIRGIENGGMVPGLPLYPADFSDDVDVPRYPIEAPVSERADTHLSACGLTPLMHSRRTQKVAIFGSQSLNQPQVLDGDDNLEADVSNKLLTLFSYLFVVCLYARYVMRMTADWPQIQTARDKTDLETHIRAWFEQYIDPTPQQSNSVEQAKRPLEAVELHISDTNDGAEATLVMTLGHKAEGIGPIKLRFALPTTGKATSAVSSNSPE